VRIYHGVDVVWVAPKFAGLDRGALGAPVLTADISELEKLEGFATCSAVAGALNLPALPCSRE
jgi:hypothetical protein